MFQDYQFRASQLPLLMTKSKKKGELSETVKSVLNEIFIKVKYGREKIICSKYLEKGTNQEQEAIELYWKKTRTFCKKNTQKFYNKYLCGTPDLILKDKVVDIKTNWDIFTFFKSDSDSAFKDYYYQLVAYMLLTGKNKADLAYCLVSNTDEAINSEIQKVKYTLNLDENSQEFANYVTQITHNNTYEDLSTNERIKIFSFDLDPSEEAKIYAQLDLCREYLQSLT